jgi:hypothetical protein
LVNGTSGLIDLRRHIVGFVTALFLVATVSPKVVYADPPTDTAAAAQAAAAQQEAARQQALLMAVLLMMECNKGNDTACMLAMLALMQAQSLGNTSAGAVDVAKQNSTGQIQGGKLSSVEVVRLQKDLAKKGYEPTADGSGITLPNGSVMPVGGAGGGSLDSGMKSAGFTDGQIGQAKALIAEVKDKADRSKSKELSGTGMGGGGGGGGGYASAPPPAASAEKSRGSGASLSGLSKNLGNDKIGVSGDDIFEMISRRYRVHQESLKQ